LGEIMLTKVIKELLKKGGGHTLVKLGGNWYSLPLLREIVDALNGTYWAAVKNDSGLYIQYHHDQGIGHYNILPVSRDNLENILQRS